MAEDNGEVRVGELGSAALKGASAAINHKVIEPLKAMTQPGDMNPEHMPHPVDDAVAKLSSIPNRLAELAEPGDMNPAHAPHPVDAALEAANHAVNQIKADGPVKGTELAAEMAVGAVIDGANPGKKLKVVDEALGTAGQVRHVEGQLVDKAQAGKELLDTSSIDIPKAGLAKLKEQSDGVKNKVLDVAEKIPVIRDMMAPTLDQRIIRQANKEKPSVLDSIDERHRIGGDESVLHAQHADKLQRAQILAEQARNNPEAAAAINRKVTSADISDLLNKSTNEQLGLPHNPDSVPKLPSPEQQAIIDARAAKLEAGQQRLADEQAYQETLNPLQKIVRQVKLDNVDAENGSVLYSRYGLSQSEQLKIEATDKDSQVLGSLAKNGTRAAGQVVAVATAGVYVATRDWSGEEGRNADASKAFQSAIANSSDKAMAQFTRDNPELKGAALYYQSAKNGLVDSHGQLSETASRALGDIANRMAKQIETEGPQVFDKPPQNLMQQEAMRQEHAR